MMKKHKPDFSSWEASLTQGIPGKETCLSHDKQFCLFHLFHFMLVYKWVKETTWSKKETAECREHAYIGKFNCTSGKKH